MRKLRTPSGSSYAVRARGPTWTPTLPLPFRPRTRSVRAFASVRLRDLTQVTWSSFRKDCGPRTLATSTRCVAGRGVVSSSLTKCFSWMAMAPYDRTTHKPMPWPRTGLKSSAIAGNTPGETAGFAQVADGHCD
eukprot:6200153-Pleurochrysis_carterae.AAC.1